MTESRTDLSLVDAMTDEELERLIAEDEDERGLQARLDPGETGLAASQAIRASAP